jgi:hypothetical protein
MDRFQKITIGAANLSYTYWISGIYKVVRYRAGEYYAFYIPEGWKNWGNYVAQSDDKVACKGHCGSARCTGWHNAWPTLRQAQKACREHAKNHMPSDTTLIRAKEILDAYLDQWHKSELTYVRMTRRTNDPKLAWLEKQLTKAGIAHRRNGESSHAPILEVEEGKWSQAWDILTPEIDNIADDDPRWTHNPDGFYTERDSEAIQDFMKCMGEMYRDC